jgi:cytochrome b
MAVARIRVWDLPIRIFHWALAALAVFSFTTGKVAGSWMDWHMRSGYAILALLLFRIAWGVAGSRTARFSSFVQGPHAFLRQAREVLARRHIPVAGHNPMGGWMVLLMLAALLAQAATGLFADDEIATQGPLAATVSNAWVERMTSWHYYNGWLIAGLVGVHVVAVGLYQWVLGDDLVRPMVTGWRDMPGVVEPRLVPTAWAAVVFAAAAAFVYWLVVVYPR